MRGPTFGIEEELFVIDNDGNPSLQSLYYLSKLVRKDPVKHFIHTDSNFSRGRDIFKGLMSGVEISTLSHHEVEPLLEDLSERREELKKVCEGLLVPMGHLLDRDTPTNTCALQFHVGNVDDPGRVYKNLVYFLPLLFLVTANAPARNGNRYGQSYRLISSYAIGELRNNWQYRFQDIIYAKRTGTIELRLFDPVWDFERIEILATAIARIVELEFDFELDADEYNGLRGKISIDGYVEELEPRLSYLSQISPIDHALLCETPAQNTWDLFCNYGLLGCYSAIDNAYREGNLEPRDVETVEVKTSKICAGLATYYIPKLPYDIWKFIKEW